MADLQFSLSRWQPSLPSDELPSALITTHSFIFIGCKSGRIYMLKRSDLSIRVVMTGCFEIVGLALGTQQIDQPFCTLETLVSIDKSGSLCAWDVQDGRCFMHNATNISPRFLLQIGSSILISSTTDSTLHLFRSSSLELVQSVDMPRPVKQATAYDGKLHCLLVDGTVWRVDYDHLVGRIMSSATQMAEYHDICHIDGINDALLLASSHQIYLLRNDKTSICPNDQTLHGVKLMSRNKALFWTFDGKMLELDNSLCSLKLVIEGYVQAVFSEDNMLHCIMRGEKLAELTLIDGQLTFSNRQIPSQQHRVISNWVSPKFQFTDYATSDGSIFYNQSLESFLDCSDQSGAEAGMFFKGKRQATCLLRLSDDMIASGTDTGRVQFWSLNQKQIVTEFRNHTTKIMNITQVKQEIMATSFDGSASVYLKDANGISTKCIFPSRGSMVKSLRWATAHDEFLMIVYEDGHHSVWNMRSRIYEVEQSSGGSGFDQVSKLFTNQIELDNRTILPSVSLDLRKLTENERFGCVELMTKVLSPETMKKSAVGVHGAGGHVTFISPEEEFWKMSPYLSAIIHLSLLSVLHVTTATQWDQLRESLEGEKFYKHHKHILPSVSVLAKFWIDPIRTMIKILK